MNNCIYFLSNFNNSNVSFFKITIIVKCDRAHGNGAI